MSPYKHRSSTILITGRMPFWCNFGVGAAAREPSPRKSVWSSHLANCAASRIVKGRTRTVTEMEDAPSAAIVADEQRARRRKTRDKESATLFKAPMLQYRLLCRLVGGGVHVFECCGLQLELRRPTTHTSKQSPCAPKTDRGRGSCMTPHWKNHNDSPANACT